MYIPTKPNDGSSEYQVNGYLNQSIVYSTTINVLDSNIKTFDWEYVDEVEFCALNAKGIIHIAACLDQITYYVNEPPILDINDGLSLMSTMAQKHLRINLLSL